MLATLTRHGVDFVVVGGFAAWTQGVPAVTADVDIVFDQDEANIERLAAALLELSALYRDPMGRQIRPEAARLASKTGGGHHLLSTNAGDLDVLRESSGFDYARLANEAVELQVATMKVKFAPLQLIIEMKEIADRPKDRAVLPLLRAALDETQD